MPDWKPRDTRRARSLRHAATPAERKLWTFLSHSRCGAKFSRQMPVGPFFADFLCRELKLAIELDGISHDREPERDSERDRYFTTQGLRVLRFTNQQVLGDADAVATAIREEVARLRALQAHP